MRLNGKVDINTSLKFKKFGKHVKSDKQSKLEYLKQYGTRTNLESNINLQDQTNLFNDFFFAQFSGRRSYVIDIDMNLTIFNASNYSLLCGYVRTRSL